ncbi:MAG: GGDEF domain-containing protein, partial [Proteobacteria bacterium]|nr:GGDEF domain-containing protein [Pseudomonadota bacterium]
MAHSHRQDIYANQLDILFNGTPHSIIASLGVATILVAIHDGRIPLFSLSVWIFLLALVMGGRYLLFRRYRLANLSPVQGATWGKSLFIGTGLTGLVWGAAGLLFFPMNSISHQVFTLLVLAGLSTASLT